MELLEARLALDATGLQNELYSPDGVTYSSINASGMPVAGYDSAGDSHALDCVDLFSNYLPDTRSLYGGDEFLTDVSKSDPLQIAIDYLTVNAQTLGLSADFLQSSVVTDHYTSPQSGTTHIYLAQSVGGIRVANVTTNINIGRDGRVISAHSNFVSQTAVNSAYSSTRTPSLTASDAVLAASQWLGLKPGGDERPAVTVSYIAAGPWSSAISYAAPWLSQDAVPVKHSYIPTADGLELSWELVVRTPDDGHWFDLAVSAQTGELLFASDWVDHASYNVYAAPIEAPNDGVRTVLTNPQLTVPSPFGWHDTNGVAGAEFTNTQGNNVSAQEDGNNDNSGGFRPDGGGTLNFDFPLDLAQPPASYQSAAITNLFYWNNWIHDVTYNYGFNEVAGNFQLNTYGRGGLGSDAVQADAQDGGGTNNANFGTPPDGLAPRMQMYVFTLTSPNRDGDLDNMIIAHEYGHGISNRLTGGPANANALDALQSGGMGEGWSDWFGLLFTMKPTDTQLAAYPVGTYVLGQSTSGGGIRRFPYSFDLGIDPLTLGDFNSSNEVHDSGEIWCSALWDLTWLLINEHGFEANLAAGYTPGAAGNLLAMQLVLDAMKLQPANPTFLQARDAILQADENLTGGANFESIWTAFARRGFGLSANVGANANSTFVTEAFDTPSFGLTVTATTPAANSVVAAPPTDFAVTFSDPYLVSSVSASDFVVNGTPANSVVFNDTTHLTFHFNVSPVIAQGLQTMDIAAATILRDSDSDAIDAFSATFRYDVLATAVVSTSPANGSTVASPLTVIDVNFNEAIAAGSISLGDLLLSQGTVVGASAFDSDTARYTVSGLTGQGSVQATLLANAVTDSATNPGPTVNFAWTFSLDIVSAAFPMPLAQTTPAGSLIYEGSVAGHLSAGDVDFYTIAVDANQTISTVLTPASGLQATVEILSPTDVVLASATAPSAGQVVTLSAVAAAAAGTYKVRLTSAGGTTGTLALDLSLNAALEAEKFGGAANNTLATAQSLAPAFITLAPSATRAAVRGTRQVSGVYTAAAAGFQFTDISGSGTLILSEVDDAFTELSDAALGDFSFNFYGVTHVNAFVSSNGLITFGSGTSTFSNSDLTSSPSQATIAAFWDDLITSSPAGAVYWQVLGTGANQQLVVQWEDVNFFSNSGSTDHLTFQAILHEATGQIEFSYQDLTSDTFSGNEGAAASVGIKAVGAQGLNRLLLANNNGPNTFVGTGKRTIISPVVPDDDFYSFSLSAGQSATLAIAGGSQLELFDVGGNSLALGASSSNLSQVINNFRSVGGGTYFARVGGVSGDYSLVVTQSADFDTESNDSLATARPLEGAQSALGGLSVGNPEDWYSINVNSGNSLTVTATMPAGGTGEFVNLLNAGLELFDPNGVSVANSFGVGAPSLAHPALLTGAYRVRVLAEASTAGEYVVQIAGATGALDAFTAVVVSPASGAAVGSAPTVAIVDFNDAVLLTSLAASDLTVDGVPATSLTVIDADTVTFLLPGGLSNGPHLIQISAGSVLDLQNTPLGALSSSFTIDGTGPRIVVSSILQNDVKAEGTLAYTAQFNEPLDEASIDPSDFILVGTLSGPIAATSAIYDAFSTSVLVQFPAIVDDSYVLTLLSGVGHLTDTAGNALDGERNGLLTVPTGNGVPGGDFSVDFVVDLTTRAFPVPLEAKFPLGSLIYDPSTFASIAPTGDVDSFTLSLDAGQTITVVADPAAGLRPTLELRNPGNSPIASITAAAAGSDALLQTISVSTSGTYTMLVSAAGGTSGQYGLSVLLNAAVEPEEHNGSANNSLITAQDLTTSFISLGGTATRGAVRGGVNTPTSGELSALSAGEIVFVQASADTPDTFAFTPLVNIAAGTLIHFADEGRLDTNTSGFTSCRRSGLNGTGSLGEGSYAWVAPINIAAGTVVSIDATVHNLLAATGGDNLLAYQGTFFRPQFVAAVGWSSTDPFITTGTASSNSSYLPSNLTVGVDALEITANLDNTGYTGTTTGTAASLRSAANNAANWTSNDTTLVAPPGALTVTDATAAANATTVFGGYSFGVNAATYTQNPTAETPNLNLSALTTANLAGTLDADGDSGFNAQDYRTTGGWSTAAAPNVLTDQALQFTATIGAGQQFDLSHFSFAAQTVTDGPQSLAVFVSSDGFATSTQLGGNLALSGTTWGVFDFTDASAAQYSGLLTVRIFGFNATNAATVLELDEIWLDGQLSLSADDYFSFTLGAGESATLALAEGAGAQLELLDAGGNTVALGTAAANLTQVINNYASAGGGVFYAKITGATSEYSLVITRAADFDTEANGSFAAAQDISGTTGALGYAIGEAAEFALPFANASRGGAATFSGATFTPTAMQPQSSIALPYNSSLTFAEAVAQLNATRSDSPAAAEPSQLASTSLTGPIPLLQSFAGPGQTAFRPPDPTAAAGPSQIVALVNTDLAIYDKATGAELFRQIMDGPGGFFGSVGATTYVFDPYVVYDEATGRFFAIGIDLASDTESNVFLAVSTDSTPTSGVDWHKYKIDFTHDGSGGLGSGAHFPDYPKLSVNDDAIWISGNYFPINAGSGVYAGITALAKTPLLSGGPAVIEYEEHFNGFSVMPMQELGSAPVQYFAEANFFGGSTIVVHAVSHVLTTPTRNTTVVSVPAYNAPTDVPQLGGASLLDSIDNRVMTGVWRDGSMWFAHNAIDPAIGDGEDVVRWYEIETDGFPGGTPTLVQAGNVDPGVGIHAWMPAVAVDGNGNLGISFSVGGSSMFAGGAFTGRLASDPLGTVALPVSTLVEGEGHYSQGRWGDYAGLAIDPTDDATFWAINEYADTGNNWATQIGAFQLQEPSDHDWYRFAVNAGDSLQLSATAPASGAGEFVNLIDAGLELYDPTGDLVATSVGVGQPSLNHVALESGQYRVHVLAESATRGEYALRVLGATGVNPVPFVIDADPDSGALLAVYPTTYTIDFSESINPLSVSAGDLLVDGVPAVAFNQLDGDTIEFTLALPGGGGEGLHTVTVAAGAVSDLQNRPNSSFTGTFTVDLTGPRIVQTLWNGSAFPANGVLAEGTLTFQAVFNESLGTAASPRRGLQLPGTDDVVLYESVSNQFYAANSVSYDDNTLTFSASFAGLPEGAYTLSLISGDNGFEDQVGNDLDGEPLGPNFDGTLTGDGVAGGNYFRFFQLDRTTPASIGSFTRLNPLGGLASQSLDNAGILSSGGDNDEHTFFAEAGSVITIVATPDSAVLFAIDLIGLLPTVFNSAPGEPVIAGPVTIPATGSYSLFTATGGPTAYTVDVYRNTALESQVGDSGDGNELPIDNSHVDLGSGRFSVLGTSTPTLASGFADRLFAVPIGQGNFITELDPETGAEINRFASPVTVANGEDGLAFDGTSLWFLTAFNDTLYELNPDTGALIDSDLVTVGTGGYDGVAAVNDLIYVLDYPGNGIHVFDPSTDTFTGTIFVAADLLGGIAGIQGPNALIVGDIIGQVLEVNPETGAINNSFNPGIGTNYAFATVGGEIYVGTLANNTMSIFSRAGTLLGTRGLPYAVGALGGDDIGSSTGGGSESGLFGLQLDTNQIVEVNPISGEILRSFPPPIPVISAVSGLSGAEGGATLIYQDSGDPAGNVFRIDPATGAVISVATMSPGARGGLSFHTDGVNNYIYAIDNGGPVDRQTGYNGAVADFVFVTPFFPGALGGDDNGRHFVFDNTGISEFNPLTGVVVNVIPSPTSNIAGLAFDGVNLYASDYVSGLLYTLNPNTGAVLTSVPVVGGGLVGLGAVSVPSADASLIDAFTVFEEDFNAGLGGFTIDNAFGTGSGLWHASTGRAADGLPGHSPPGSVYYGQLETAVGGGNYDAGDTEGIFYSPEIDLPTDGLITLSFNHLLATEGNLGFDQIEVAVDDGSGYAALASSAVGTLPTGTGGSWQNVSLDLSAYAGESVRIRFRFDTVDAGVNTAEGWYVDDVSVTVSDRPDVDEYQLDLTGFVGQTIDVLLDGQSQADFSVDTTLELIGPDDLTVFALGNAAPLGVDVTNYDQGILGFSVSTGGVYTVRITSFVAGQYGLVVTDSLVFDTEANDTAADSLRSLDGVNAALGHATELTDSDRYTISLVAGQRLKISTQTLFDDAQGDPLNELDPQLAIYDPFGVFVTSDDNSAVDGKNARTAFQASISGVYTIELAAVSGRGEYLIELDEIPDLHVTTTADSGDGSLRQAILDANDTPGVADTILFEIPGSGIHSIDLDTPLPTLLDSATLHVPAINTIEVGTLSPDTFTEYPQLIKIGAGALAIGGAQSHATSAALSVAEGLLELRSDGGPNLSAVVQNGGMISLASDQHLSSLTVTAGGSVVMPAVGDHVLVLSELVVDGGGTIDVNDHDLVIHATPTTRSNVLAYLNGKLALGAQGGWNGTEGITSTSASLDPTFFGLGILLNDVGGGAPYHTSFHGEPVGVNDVLIRFTVLGDTELDRDVDFDDAFTLVNFYGLTSEAVWSVGDFDYDGDVDFDDAFVQINNYGASAPVVAGNLPAGAMPSLSFGDALPAASANDTSTMRTMSSSLETSDDVSTSVVAPSPNQPTELARDSTFAGEIAAGLATPAKDSPNSTSPEQASKSSPTATWGQQVDQVLETWDEGSPVTEQAILPVLASDVSTSALRARRPSSAQGEDLYELLTKEI